jgi:hypothetical protein
MAQGSSEPRRRPSPGPSAVRPGTYDHAYSRRAIHEREVRAVTTNEAEELLMIEEADAWFEYLEATHGQQEPRYKEIEPWAWARLTQRLRAINARRARLRPAAA